jgi:hypothetical protein
MALWAASGEFAGSVGFLCINTDVGAAGYQAARSFGARHRFPAALKNGFVETATQLPRFGQLGCSGFIVLARDGSCINPRTPAYLQYGDAAFEAVEKYLRLVVAAAAAAPQLPAVTHTSAQINMSSSSSSSSSNVARSNKRSSSGQLVAACTGNKCSLKRSATAVAAGISDGSSTDGSHQQQAATSGIGGGSTINVSAAHHRLAAPASVGVQEMDDEHAACTKVILQVYFTAYLYSKYWQCGL